jgi:hypothetical protein
MSFAPPAPRIAPLQPNAVGIEPEPWCERFP